VDIEPERPLGKDLSMLDKRFADEFSREWIESWNAHDLPRILGHYADDLEMSSPLIAQLVGQPSGFLKSKSAVAAYWRKALDLVPDLHFTLTNCFVGAESLVISYKSSLGRAAAETLVFNSERLVCRAFAHYA
jgi:hypothetical protein